MNSGIYTGVNGPMYSNANNGQEAMHHFITDHILGLQPWLDTMCSFPCPWANQSTQSQNSKQHITKTKNEYKQNWQNAYLGTYGHRLFGNITVTYNQSREVLQFKAGKYCEGFLHRDQGEMFAVELIGTSWYIQNTGDPEPPYFIPPVRFSDQQDGVWIGLERSRPPSPHILPSSTKLSF